VLLLRAKPSRGLFAFFAVVALGCVAACGCKDRGPKPPPPPRPEPSARTDKAPQTEVAPGVWAYDHVGDAIKAIVARDKPRVIGFGEVHVLKSSASIRSALERFTEHAVPALAESGASNLVLETWVEREQCGEVQKKVDNQVRADTERPPETESELVRLLRAVDEEDIGRHGMVMSCDEYKALLDKAGKVDYPKLLSLITGKLAAKAKEVLGRSPGTSIVFLYGGALHNNLYPPEGVEDWSYAQVVSKLAPGGYVEVDFLVPELIDNDEALAKEEWFAHTKRPELEKGVLLVARGERSYVVLARRKVAARKPQPAAQSPQ